MVKAPGRTCIAPLMRLQAGGRPLRSRWRSLLWLCPLLLVGCAKTGDPHPPVALVPKPATDLTAIQYSDQVMLTFSMPSENTDGSPVVPVAQIQVLRCDQSDRTKDVPMPEADFVKQAVVISSVSSDRIAEFLHDKTLRFRDELTLSDRSVIYREAFRYAVRTFNRKKQSAGLSNQVFVAPVPIPPSPKGLSAEVTQPCVTIRWDPPTENVDGSQPPAIEGYRVYRTEDPKNFPPASLNSELLQKSEYEDRTFQFDKTYYYAVSVVASREKPYAESLPSTALKVVTRDTFPPGPPRNLNGVPVDGAVLLLWGAPPDPDVAGYRVYRKEVGSAAFELLQKELIAIPSHRDAAVRVGAKYIYRVTAVDTHGNEGTPAETTVDVP